MTFRLKDKNLQVPLDALSDGDFSKRLQHANHDDGMIFVEFGEKLESPGFDLHRFNLAFFDDEVKEIHRYNPHGWNDYSKVNPPEGVLMRVECHDGSKACAQLRFFEREGFCRPEGLWCDIDGTPWPIADSDAVVRFRPWDDPDGEEDEE